MVPASTAASGSRSERGRSHHGGRARRRGSGHPHRQDHQTTITEGSARRNRSDIEKDKNGKSDPSFLPSNFRFVIRPFATSKLIDVDTLPCWEDVELLITRSPVLHTCPICLDSPPEFPVSTRCGHVFCTLCILRHIEIEEVRSCPICLDTTVTSDLRRTITWKEVSDLSFRTPIGCTEGVSEANGDEALLGYQSCIEEGGSLPVVVPGMRLHFRAISKMGPPMKMGPPTDGIDSEASGLFTPLIIDLVKNIPQLGCLESVFSRVCTTSGQHVLKDLEDTINILRDRHHLCITEWTTKHGEPTVRLPEYASVAAGRNSQVEIIKETRPLPTNVLIQLSVLHAAVQLYTNRASLVQQRLDDWMIHTACDSSDKEGRGITGKRNHCIFQNISGLDIFLHPLCMEILESAKWGNNNSSISNYISGTVVDIDRVMVTKQARKRFKGLLNEVPLNTWIVLVLLDVVEILLVSFGFGLEIVGMGQAQRVRLLKDQNILDKSTLDKYLRVCRLRKNHYVKAKLNTDQELNDYRLAQALTIADILEIQDSRETRNEVLIQDLLSGPVVGTHNVSSSLNHNVPMSCVSRGDEDRGISAKEDSGEAGDIRGTKPLKIIKSPAYSKGTYASVAENRNAFPELKSVFPDSRESLNAVTSTVERDDPRKSSGNFKLKKTKQAKKILFGNSSTRKYS